MVGPKKHGRPRIERPPPADFDDDPLGPSVIDGILSVTQRRLLRLLFSEPNRAFGVRELRELTRGGGGATQRALRRLESAGIVTATRRGNRTMVQANPLSPIHAELTAMVRNTIGMAEPLREAFGTLAGKMQSAFAFEPERDPLDRRSRDLGMVVFAQDADAWATDLLISRGLAEELLGRGLWIMVRRPEQRGLDAFVEEQLRRPGVWVFQPPVEGRVR